LYFEVSFRLYTDNFSKATRYPDYFNGKLFFYEWMRDWIKIVTTVRNGDFDKMDPFDDLVSEKAITTL